MANSSPRRYQLVDKPLPEIQLEVNGEEPNGNRRRTFIRRSPAIRLARGSHPEDTTPLTPIESTYMSAFQAVDLPEMQTKIDGIEEKLSAPVAKATEAYDKLNAFYTANSATISSAGSALASAVNLDVKSIENTITTFAETSAVLLKGLDALGQLHPFVGIAVTAFKLVITLDITRRQNNKKVLAVKIQMQDLMTILFQLRHMHDPEEKGPDGTTLKDRMSGLMQSIAKSITACGSACDVYVKKSFLAKTLKSKIYEGRLAGYVTMFANHKKEIGFALKVHTALGVDQANKKLDGQDAHLKLIEDKMEALFRKLDTPRERDVQRFVEDQGGAKACVDNDATLRELVSKSGESLASMDLTHSGSGDLANAKKFLNKELAEDVDEAFRKNIKLFDRKLEMQSKQLTDAISSTGEHIIDVLSGGAHDKILDEELQTIWKDMGWKGSVKARYFVLALNDYYTEKFSNSDMLLAAESNAGSVPPSPLMSPTSTSGDAARIAADSKPKDDRWALAYVNVAHVQAILEAVDDDGTGFVSIKEANDFAVSRPEGWSLLSWVALWAAGWHGIVTWYKNRIYNLLKAMFRLSRRVHPANRKAVDKYLGGESIQKVELLLRSTRSAPADLYDDPRLTEIADAFQNEQDSKLEERLSGVEYELDDTTTVRLVTGPGRIERYVYPLVFWMIKRHFDMIRLACKHVLDPAEFDMMNYSLYHIFDALNERTRNLEAIFKQTHLDVKARLGNFAFGMFQAAYAINSLNEKYDPINNTIVSWKEEQGYAYDDEDLGPQSDDDEETQAAIFNRMDLDILRYDLLDAAYENPTYNFETLHPPPTPADPIDGVWSGHLLRVADDLSSSAEGLLSLVITRNGDALSGGAENFLAVSEISGTVDAEHNVEFTITWPDEWSAACTGKYDPETDTLVGFWERNSDDSDSESSEDEGTDDPEESPGDENGGEDAESSEDKETDDPEESPADENEGEDDADVSEPEQDEETTGEEDDAAEADDTVAAEGDEEITGEGDAVTEANDAVTAEGSDKDDTEQNASFVFHRTPSSSYRFRYTSEEFKTSRARARWAFAIAAVIHDVQRAHWAWRYFKQRFAERRRFVHLNKADKIARQNLTPWIVLDDDETAELNLLKAQLAPADARFYNAIADYEIQFLVDFNGRSCDSCMRDMTEVRLICLQCLDPLYSDGIDICIECIDQTPERDGFVHLVSHVLVKVTRYIHDGELAAVLPQARVVADRVKAAFRASGSLLARLEGGPSMGERGGNTHSGYVPTYIPKAPQSEMVCCCCGEVVSCPCWVCITCVPDTFICSDCDTNKATALADGPCPSHDRDHPLVQIRDSDPIPEPLTTDSRLADLEVKLAGLETKVEDRLAALEEKLEGRFLTLETLLQQISSQLAANRA
ncbi:hypothetical protein C8R44DRAFT_704054 [Mycena epipterygia]|nr:hypothetical protein C8R44DRAFT_704054 [Mycena epipterygia]